jgi:hypothetical protein
MDVIYDPVLKPKGWFDPVLDLSAWFSEDFISSTIVEATVSGVFGIPMG